MPPRSAAPIDARRAIRQALTAWRERGPDAAIAASAVATAWADTEPDFAHWRRWLDRVLLALGVAMLCAGVVVFFAYNWAELHKFARFGLLAGLVTVLASIGWYRTPPDPVGLAALFGAQVAGGVLLAVIGQTYQTGADAWQLFALWALLGVPWALGARAPAHWWLVMVLANVVLLRWFSIRPGADGMLQLLFDGGRFLPTGVQLLAATLIQLVLWFLCCAKAPGLGFRGATGARIAATLACAYGTALGLTALLARQQDWPVAGLALAALAALAWWFRMRRFDIVMLSEIATAAIVLIVATVARVLFDGRGEFGAFLLLGVLTIALSAMASKWLRACYRLQTTTLTEVPA
jgi:uncharacterized membrane protein